MGLPSREPNVLGDTSLSSFDAIVIGSGAGGSAAAYILATHGKKVLVLETGDNYFPGLDDPAPGQPVPLFGNDELKEARDFEEPDELTEPRTFRSSDADGTRTLVGDVNGLPKTVGGAAVHADMKYPRLQDWDFHLRSEIGEVMGANFADWPLSYDELEPFYTEVEYAVGVQGIDGADPFAPRRARPYPMPPGPPMYAALLAADGATKAGYHPFPYPTAVNSRPYRGRPPCVDCGFCGGFGCPNNSKSSPAVTFLRDALLSGNCQVRYNSTVTRLIPGGVRGLIAAVEYLDPAGKPVQAKADIVILAASPIEDARLCLLSDPGGPGLGNSSGQMGRNLMFHFQTIAVGFFRQRLHGHRGRAVTHGMSDFRGRPSDAAHPLGGIIEFGANADLIGEAKNASSLGTRGDKFVTLMRDSPFRDRIAALTMQAEDAPQLTNYVDLDPEVRDVYGLPVPRITYKNHAWELATRDFYGPKMVDIMGAAGAQFSFVAPMDTPPASRHVMGTLRMGSDATSSVCDAFGKFHDFDNLYCADGALFVTSSGYNPTLTIQALALRTAANILYPGSAQRALRE